MFKNLADTAALLDRNERYQVVGIVIFMLGSVLLETIGVALIFPLVRILIDPDSIFRFRLLNSVYRLFDVHGPRHFLAACSVGFLALIVFKSAYNALLTGYQERLCHRISSRVGTRLMTRYLSDPWSVLLQRNSADMINVADVMSGWPLTNALRGYPVIATEGLLSVAILGVMFFVAPYPALFSIVIFGLALFVSHSTVRRQLMSLSDESAALGSARIRLLQESLASVKELKILGREARFIGEYAEARKRDASNLTRLMTWQSIPRALVEPMAVGAMTVAVLAVSMKSANDVPATAAVLGLFAVAGVRLTPSLTRMLVAANSIRASSGPLERIKMDLIHPLIGDTGSTETRVPQLRREIRAENISYRYQDGAEPVLHYLSFSIAKGETVGLMGPSGSGKSTLADIITGLLTPTGGSILIDGTDISGDVKGWQKQIGYIPQNVSVIDATLPENIALGVTPGEIDMDRVHDAIALARLEGLSRTLSLDARLGERGIRLSGGERQRIGIARAIYHGRSVLVMDEATSALDSETENEIGEALSRIRGNHTILIIAHRVSTMRRCDNIMLLHEGRIIDRGPPDAMEKRLSGRARATQH